ncbi:MAG TPA: hypothetical protein VK843_16810 [Planctomycetota bacterium]|nr:hypothetical protein [Planctomycetota bacterium]
MARPSQTAPSASRTTPPPPTEPGTLVRLKAAAAAVGVDEEELKRRAAAAGVKVHTVVRAGEAQAALDLEDVWRLRSDVAAIDSAPAEAHPSGVEVARLASRLEREAEEHRARHAQALERSRSLEDAVRAGEQALRVEKSKQAQLESQLSESARTLAETQRSILDLRASQAAREREFKTSLEEERKTSAGAAQAIETARLQAEGSARGRAAAEERVETSLRDQATLREELTAARRDNEKLQKEIAEVKTLRARITEHEGAIVKLNATVAREQAEAKSARELASTKAAEAARSKLESERLVPFEKRVAEVEEAAAKAASAAALELAGLRKELEAAQTAAARDLANETTKRDAAETSLKTSYEEKLKQALAAAAKAEAARTVFERELAVARGELEKIEESCARSALDRERFKQRIETLSSQLATAQEGESAIQRYADRKETELAELREELRHKAEAALQVKPAIPAARAARKS